MNKELDKTEKARAVKRYLELRGKTYRTPAEESEVDTLSHNIYLPEPPLKNYEDHLLAKIAIAAAHHMIGYDPLSDEPMTYEEAYETLKRLTNDDT